MSKAVVAFGSNIEPERFLPAAVRELARRVRLLAVSPVYQTPPVGAPGTPPFLNGALLVETSLSPRELRWQVLRPIEAALGRVRGEDPNAPRTVDLDLVLYEGRVCAEPDLELPAPDVLPVGALRLWRVGHRGPGYVLLAVAAVSAGAFAVLLARLRRLARGRRAEHPARHGAAL